MPTNVARCAGLFRRLQPPSPCLPTTTCPGLRRFSRGCWRPLKHRRLAGLGPVKDFAVLQRRTCGVFWAPCIWSDEILKFPPRHTSTAEYPASLAARSVIVQRFCKIRPLRTRSRTSTGSKSTSSIAMMTISSPAGCSPMAGAHMSSTAKRLSSRPPWKTTRSF